MGDPMKKIISIAFTLFSLASLHLVTFTQEAHGQLRPYRVTDTQVRTLLTRIETNTDTFRNRLNTALDSSSINGSRSEDEVVQYVSDFEQATDQLRERFNGRNLETTDVQEVLGRASYIDRFMRNNRLTTVSQNQWTAVRTDLNTLASYYRVTWNWNNPNWNPSPNFPGNNTGGNYPGNNYPGNNNPGSGWGNNRGDAMLTGTYRLNRSASDDVQRAVGETTGTAPTLGTGRGGRGQNSLIRRLTPPEMMAIQKNNREITIASDMAPQAVITADGIARTETSANGRNTFRTTTSLQGNGFVINTEGDRNNDFYVSFTPQGSNQLRVVRRVYRENTNQTITVASVYDKISPTANWSSIDSGSNTGNYPNDNYPNNNSGADTFIVPDGTRIVGSLENSLSTKTVADGERFTMRVMTPSQYGDAIISGYVSSTERSGRVTGRANMTLNFEEIRLRNGRTYKFAGAATDVKLPNGERVTVNNEGAVREDSQTKKTVVRSGIGAAIGAIIGAVAGGGSGAAIGAAVGAGAGAGSVVIQGRDDLVLNPGTEFVITASAPQNLGSLR